MSRESTKKALMGYFDARAKEQARDNLPKKKRDKPEMDLVQKPCKAWFRLKGWAMFIIDAKAEWSPARQAYVPREEVAAGFSDSVGCTPNGIAAFVEFKAPGKRSTLKMHQREFLKDKIDKGCFAVCVDSVEGLEEAWLNFDGIRAIDRNLAINYLHRHLPPVPAPRRGPPGTVGPLFE